MLDNVNVLNVCLKQAQQCRVHDQVCCTIVREAQETFVKTKPNGVILEGDESGTKYNEIPGTKGDSGQNVFESPTQSIIT